ncbi:MAG: ABC transporter substrate-binding protein [Balneolaceae bacterium]|nr:ABC transporter substrate-binding protein [Balneolaceae bacterium]MBO6546249.1 ABC transporter substrate-binding protein [Balneolaceae bacterium]
MKKALLLIFFVLTSMSTVFGQTFESGLDLYQQGDYERAARILQQSDEPEAILFTGKSYFSLNNYLLALYYLNTIPENSATEIKQEAQFTAALTHFQLDDFAKSLDILKTLSKAQPSGSTTRAALTYYDQILGYLTLKQRREVFRESVYDEVRLDVLESSIGLVSYSSAISLLNLYKRSVPSSSPLRLNRIETMLNDSVSYMQRYNPNRVVQAPKGISYNIGVVLPEFEYEAPEYEIPQHLYFGIQLAVEEFNSENADQKAFITYRNTNDALNSAEGIVNDLVWNEDVDFILGPLFSGVAKEFSNLAEEYEVPLLLPLANADSLDLYNDYVFQLNPSFATQGKVMANYAVNTLGYDTLGVIAEKGSLGDPAARSFVHEAERNGALVEYYFVENLEEYGYDIRDYTQFFTSDTLDSVDMVEAVYAPFTGTVAATLVESMLTDLEAMRSTVAILGSEEWMNVNLEDRRLDETELYYTESFNVDTSTVKANTFASSFRLRFSTQPNQFAYIGYDAAKIVLETLKRVKNPAYLRDALKDLNNYEGMSTRVSFRGAHVNHEIKIKRMPRDSDLLEEITEDSIER